MAVAKSIGSGLGAIFNNPGALALGLVAVGLFIFRDKISNFVQTGFDNFKFPEIKLPEFPTFPDITFPDFPQFPEITFPEFPDFTNIFQGFQDQLDSIVGGTIGGTTVSPTNPPSEPTPVDDPVLDSPLGPITPGENCVLMPDGTVVCDSGPTFDVCVAFPELCQTGPSNTDPFDGSEGFIGPVQPPGTLPTQPGFEVGPGSPFIGGPGTGMDVPLTGVTTFGDNLIDTLSEVLNIFTNLTASQASNLLFDNPGLTGNEFAQLNPFGSSSISSAGGDPEQIINNSSGDFSGLTPEQIANILTGGNINNF